MKRVASGAYLNAQKIEPTTAWTTVSSPSANTRYSLSKLSGLGGALCANSMEGSAQWAYFPVKLGLLAVPIHLFS